MSGPLAQSLKPCGPIVDEAAAKRARTVLLEAVGEASLIAEAWPALAPIVSASPYLAGLASAGRSALEAMLAADPAACLADLIAATDAAASLSRGEGAAALRRLKGQLHLLAAVCDLGGVWDLDQVTGALTDFADAALRAAVAIAAGSAVEAGRLQPPRPPVRPVPCPASSWSPWARWAPMS